MAHDGALQLSPCTRCLIAHLPLARPSAGRRESSPAQGDQFQLRSSRPNATKQDLSGRRRSLRLLPQRSAFRRSSDIFPAASVWADAAEHSADTLCASARRKFSNLMCFPALLDLVLLNIGEQL